MLRIDELNKIKDYFDKKIFGDPKKILNNEPIGMFGWFNIMTKVVCVILAIYFFATSQRDKFIVFYLAILVDYVIMLIAVGRIRRQLEYQALKKQCSIPERKNKIK